jgi:hypothetical protein
MQQLNRERKLVVELRSGQSTTTNGDSQGPQAKTCVI